MTITQKEIDKKIEWRFELYKQELIKEKYRQFQKEEFLRMTGAIIAMLTFGLIDLDKYNELWDRATELYKKAEADN